MLKNFVEESATNPGSALILALGGAPPGRSPFIGPTSFTTGERCFYVITDGTQREWGVGTLQADAPNKLTRTLVIGNSNGTTARLDFTGACRVYNDLPSEYAQGYMVGPAFTLPADGAVDIEIPPEGFAYEVTARVLGLAGSGTGRLLIGFISTDGTNFIGTTSYAEQVELIYGGSYAVAQSAAGYIAISSLYDVPAFVSTVRMTLFPGTTNGILFECGHVRDGSTRAIRRGWVEIAGPRMKKLRIVDNLGVGVRAGSTFSLRRLG